MWMMLEGAGILLAGMGLGRFWPARRKGPKTPKPIKPICGCGHDVSFHDPESKNCHGTRSQDKYDSDGDWVGVKYVECTCRRYTGPEPLTTYYMPELTGMEER